MPSYFNNLNLIALFWRWRKEILTATIVAGIAAIIFSSPFFIKPLFSSTAIVYPDNIKPYSQENNTEQMLQFFESADIRDSIIKKFDLYKHYAIDPSEDQAYYSISLYYKDAVSIRKTLYESVEIKVSDTDPETARSMVNSIMDAYNKKVKHVRHEKFGEVFTLRQRMVSHKFHEIDSLNQLLKGMHSKNQLINFDKQTSEMIKGYLGTVDGVNKSSINMPEVLRLKKELENNGTDFFILDQQFRQAIIQLGRLKSKEDSAYRDYNSDLSYINVITAPYAAQKKSYPVRWIIIVSAMLVTILTSMIVVTLIENRKKITAAITSQPN